MPTDSNRATLNPAADSYAISSRRGDAVWRRGDLQKVRSGKRATRGESRGRRGAPGPRTGRPGLGAAEGRGSTLGFLRRRHHGRAGDGSWPTGRQAGRLVTAAGAEGSSPTASEPSAGDAVAVTAFFVARARTTTTSRRRDAHRRAEPGATGDGLARRDRASGWLGQAIRPAPHSASAACTATAAIAFSRRRSPRAAPRPRRPAPSRRPAAPRGPSVQRSDRGRAPRSSSELRGERVALREQPGQARRCAGRGRARPARRRRAATACARPCIALPV